MQKLIPLFLFFLSHSLLTMAQETSSSYGLEKYVSRIRLSGEELRMEGAEPNIGFVGHGYEVFGLASKVPEMYLGVNSYSAITGNRSGFFVFGVTGGYEHHLFTEKLHYDIGFFLGGGGGSGTPDGGGLMLRPHADITYELTPKLALRSGVSYVRFPTGTIDSFNFNVGLSVNTNTYMAREVALQSQKENNTSFRPIEIHVLSSNLLGFSKGPLKNNETVISKDVELISLLGATIKIHHKSHFYGVVKLGGAFVGEVDGFAMLLSGLGYELPITRWFSLNTQAFIGGAGGGNVAFGGGFATQFDVGAAIKIKKYVFNVNYGKTFAPNGDYESNHLDISLGKRFDLFHQDSKEAYTTVTGKNFALEAFTFSLSNRTYLLPADAIGKFGVPYKDTFSLINFELEKKINTKLSVLMTTNWAYLGDYGAYAEGWVGMQYYPLYRPKKWNVSMRALFGAGGGGGLDLGSGMVYQYGLGLEKSMNTRWSFSAGIGQVRPVFDGNFTPVFADLGLKLNLNHLVRK